MELAQGCVDAIFLEGSVEERCDYIESESESDDELDMLEDCPNTPDWEMEESIDGLFADKAEEIMMRMEGEDKEAVVRRELRNPRIQDVT
jgi:hypothetical protein